MVSMYSSIFISLFIFIVIVVIFILPILDLSANLILALDLEYSSNNAQNEQNHYVSKLHKVHTQVDYYQLTQIVAPIANARNYTPN